MAVEAPVEEVHEVRLAEVAERHDLLPWQGRGARVMQVANGDPLLNISGQEQNFTHVDKHPGEHFIEDFWSDELRAIISHLRHDIAVENKAGPIELVAPVKVETASL